MKKIAAALVVLGAFAATTMSSQAQLPVPNCATGVITNTQPPAVTGTPAPGYTLTSSPGQWQSCGMALTSTSYRWYGGAANTTNSYTLTSADVGRTLYTVVTVCNAEGCVDSPPSNQVVIQSSPPSSGVDADNDKVTDSIDNCGKPGTTLVYNPDQADDDGDGVGNACDSSAPSTFLYDPDGEIRLQIGAVYGFVDGTGAYSCRDYEAAEKVQNRITHRRYFTYYAQARVCYNGKTIKSVPMTSAWGTTRWPWEFNGNQSLSAGGAGQATVQVFAQGKFNACLFKYGCVNSMSPWLRITVTSNGVASCQSDLLGSNCPIGSVPS